MAKRTKAVETPEDARLRKVAEETVRQMVGLQLVMDRMQRAEAQVLEMDTLRRELREAQEELEVYREEELERSVFETLAEARRRLAVVRSA